MARQLIILLIALSGGFVNAQEPNSEKADSAKLLNEVVVRAFEYNKQLRLVPASVGLVDSSLMVYFGNQSMVLPINSIAGVRMEERSPGSYRLSLRGSTLRSPFGVRNVKVYWNGSPLTDAGGNTYLNILDPAAIGSLEIIKGPGSSLYGAGNGGTVLIDSRAISQGIHLSAGGQYGGYGMSRRNISLEHGSSYSSQSIGYMHHQADGYRDHTRMIRDLLTLTLNFYPSESKHSIEADLFYSDLFYQTPGGLTLSEFNGDPRQSRPATATLPSATEQKAAVMLKALYGTVLHEYELSKHARIVTNVSSNSADFVNRSIRNVEARNEVTFGTRSVAIWNTQIANHNFQLTSGGEFQRGKLPVLTYENNGGTWGVLMTNDDNTILQYSLFSQFDINLGKLDVSGGISINHFNYKFDRSFGTGAGKYERQFSEVVIPRIALLWAIDNRVSVYGSVSRGFSPPTLAEIISSTGEINTELDAEIGTNVEAGLKSNWLAGKLNTELTAYSFTTNNAIILKRPQDIAEYFANAGKTRQNGIETALRYTTQRFQSWLSYAYQQYSFVDYVDGVNNYSGNELTGAPSEILNGGIRWKPGHFYFQGTLNATSKLPLNDANSVYADSYEVLNFKSGYRKHGVDFFVGVDNVFDKLYSLGNDINAFGGRYYNAAPRRSFYVGADIKLPIRKQ